MDDNQNPQENLNRKKGQITETIQIVNIDIAEEEGRMHRLFDVGHCLSCDS